MPFVLVHGGGFAASCWEELLPLLNPPAFAVDLPGRGTRPADLSQVCLEDFAATVVDEIESRNLSDVVLVGHSMAGITLPRVAALVPSRLSKLVFVSCAVPPKGVSISEILSDLSPTAAAVAEQLGENLVDERGALHPDFAAVMFCNDMDPDLARSTLARMVPESMTVLAEPADLTGLAEPIPRTYVRLSQDASITLEQQNAMITRLGAVEVLDLDAGHMAMISQPAGLAGILNAA